MFGIFGRKRREEERRRQEEQENRLRRARLLDAPGSPRSAANDSQMNPASHSGMILSPVSPISPNDEGVDYPTSSHCSGSPSSDSGSSCSGSDGGGD